jgi:hypothetical protein
MLVYAGLLPVYSPHAPTSAPQVPHASLLLSATSPPPLSASGPRTHMFLRISISRCSAWSSSLLSMSLSTIFSALRAPDSCHTRHQSRAAASAVSTIPVHWTSDNQ